MCDSYPLYDFTSFFTWTFCGFSSGLFFDVSKDFKRVLTLSLSFLEPDERKILQALIKNRGSLPQAKLDAATALHRVKVHRGIEKLLARGIVLKEVCGRTNKILLAEDFISLVEE